MRFFDPKRKTCLNIDLLKTGLGYWLCQKHCTCESDTPDCCDHGWYITLVGSRFLSFAGHRYAPVEGEVLAVVCALEDTKLFTLGCDNLTVTAERIWWLITGRNHKHKNFPSKESNPTISISDTVSQE